ncbi:L-2-hydroxyglutarate oxidase [Corynebacterium uropygiale]|uniref:L-2-hydroxyglutarate oxidase n=1 Tax=Corynebacterium uropygiale TaxID=1775911 RepID=A0A9X1QQR3_9CORY|nr:L-2-hydroxyglutarate oxidase [Corynebacterium uropygiale]MCF4007584.1 L-2-hydroxyglutarate oxidase [Corynebacterium uropygiale]
MKCAVIGAGIIGVATAREVQRQLPGAEVTIIDKEGGPAAHQTGHNSGVVHAGLYYQPGSLKATLCRRGVDLLTEYATSRGLPFEECGKLVVSLSEEEDERLRAIAEKAIANKVPDVELIGPEGIRAIEPNATGRLALHSPHTGIIDYAAVTRALLEDVRQAGGRTLFGAAVTNLINNDNGCAVELDGGREGQRPETFDLVIVCAGLHSDRLARMAGAPKYPVIVPFFGQYSQLAPEHRDILRGLVYPVPDPAYPFLGVHLTKRVDGEMLVGPNAFLSFGRENYRGWALSPRDSLGIAMEPGFWRFAAQNMRAAQRELGAVLSRRAFLAGAEAYVPSLHGAASTPITRGIRAQAMNADGSLVDDFVIHHVGRAVLLRNAPSPGATSSLAIAEHLVARTREMFEGQGR